MLERMRVTDYLTAKYSRQPTVNERQTVHSFPLLVTYKVNRLYAIYGQIRKPFHFTPRRI